MSANVIVMKGASAIVETDRTFPVVKGRELATVLPANEEHTRQHETKGMVDLETGQNSVYY